MPETDPGVRKAVVIGLSGSVVAIVLIVLVALQARPTKPSGSVPLTPHSVGIGETGVLSKGDGEIVPLGATKVDFDQMTKTLLAKDDVGWNELVTSGRVIGVDHGTRVRVIDRGLYWRQVRVMEGTYKDRSGYLPVEWVIPEG